MTQTRADLLCDAALSQLGITEDPPGSNDNPYGAYYGMNGVAWCALFVRWCAEQAGLPFPAIAYVPTLEQWARDNGYAIDAAEVRRGDVVCLDFTWPAHDGADHVEIALGPVVDGWVECIGGNTSDRSGGSVDNGGGVFVNRRPVEWISNGTALRLPGSDDPLTPTPPPPPATTEEEQMLFVHTPTQRPVPFNGRPVLDLWIASNGITVGRTGIMAALVIWPANPADAADPARPLVVEVHEHNPDGRAAVNTVTVAPGSTPWPTNVGGLVSVVCDPDRPVVVQGREVHYSVAS